MATAFNIWACAKDVDIKHLLLLLQEEFAEPPYHIGSDDNTDARAIRLQHPDGDYAMYIYTYGQQPGKYGVHLEYANDLDRRVSDTLEVFDDLDYAQLLALIKVQFC